MNEIAPAVWKALNARATRVRIATAALLARAAIAEAATLAEAAADFHGEAEAAAVVVAEAAVAKVSGSRFGRLPVGIILGRLPSKARTRRYF